MAELKTTENKISVTTHFKKLTTGNHVLLTQLLSKVTVISLSSYIKLFNVSAKLLLDNALLKCVVTEVILSSLFSCCF